MSRGSSCWAAITDRTSSTIGSGAFAGDPASNGGWGSYSMASCTAWAASGPYSSSVSRSAMSMPEDTPAAVMTLPCSTTRRGVGRAPYCSRVSSSSQWDVASSPSRIPAAASTSDPVQTDVV